MREETAKEILAGCIEADDTLYNLGKYLRWEPCERAVTLDGQFTADQLEAIAWWMRHKNRE